MIIPRISMFPEDFRAYTDKTVEHMEHFAKEGFRTLVLAYRIISEEDYQVATKIDHKQSNETKTKKNFQ